MITIICSVIFSYYFTKPKITLENDLCKSTINLKLNNNTHSFEYNMFITFSLTDTGRGYEDMRGVVIKDGKKYTLSRSLDFNYIIRNNNNYEINIVNTTELGPDDIPAEVVSKYFSYTLPNSITILKVNEIGKNLILVSGLQGPTFICSVL